MPPAVVARLARHAEPGERPFQPARVVEQRIAGADRREERRQRAVPAALQRQPGDRLLEHAQRIGERGGRPRPGRMTMQVRRAGVADHSIDPARQAPALREPLRPRHLEHGAERQHGARHQAGVVHRARPRLVAALARGQRERRDQVAAGRLARDRDPRRIAAERADPRRQPAIRRAGVLDRRRVGMLGREPVGDVDHQVAEPREHQAHQPVSVLRQQVKRAAVDVEHHRPRAGAMDRPVDVEPVPARVGAIDHVALDLDAVARRPRRRMQRRRAPPAPGTRSRRSASGRGATSVLRHAGRAGCRVGSSPT